MQLKTGLKSTEFYLSFIPTIVSMLILGGFIGETDRAAVEELFKMAIAGIVSIVSIVAYILSRTDLKRAAIGQSKSAAETKELLG